MTTQADAEREGSLATTSAGLLGWAMVIGLCGGLLAVVYYLLLQGALSLVWERLLGVHPLSLPVEPTWHPGTIVVTTIGGLVVGLLTRWLGSAGEIAAVVDNIHVRHGRIDIRQTPSMITTSLASISAGGSAGPEAPLVQIIGSFSSWLGDRLRVAGHIVRTFTFCGMSAALGAFFGAPLGGALFALEIPHRRGIEYYEALLPAIVASLVGFLVFRSFVGYEHILFHFHDDRPLELIMVVWGIGFGAVGAAVAMVFAATFDAVGRLTQRWEKTPVRLAVIGGGVLGLLAQVAPMSLFWGEFQIDRIINGPVALLERHTTGATIGLLLLLAVVKVLAVSVTLRTGFRGGFIFPLMFIGAAVGTAATLLLPNAPVAVVIVATMAATNVGITKTPVSTSVILVTLTGISMMPVVIAASIVSLLLTSRLNLIHTQRNRSG
ncbi:MAG: chloride channel protein [Planctomycetes bacterium]|nr:chloride channel protein [Planctomycetota bacterium]